MSGVGLLWGWVTRMGMRMDLEVGLVTRRRKRGKERTGRRSLSGSSRDRTELISGEGEPFPPHSRRFVSFARRCGKLEFVTFSFRLVHKYIHTPTLHTIRTYIFPKPLTAYLCIVNYYFRVVVVDM